MMCNLGNGVVRPKGIGDCVCTSCGRVFPQVARALRYILLYVVSASSWAAFADDASRPNAERFELDPERATNEQLADVFERAVASAGTIEPARARIRKWKAPVRVWTWNFSSGDIAREIQAEVIRRINVESPQLVFDDLPKGPNSTENQRAPILWLQVKISDPKEADARPDILKNPPRSSVHLPRARGAFGTNLRASADEEIEPYRPVYAGFVFLRQRDNELTGGAVRIAYSYNYQYLRYELPVGILRSQGLSSAQIFSTLSIPTQKELAKQWENLTSGKGIDFAPRVFPFVSPKAEELVKAYLDQKSEGAPSQRDAHEQSCLYADFRHRVRDIIDNAFSDALGVSWGAQFDHATYQSGPRSIVDYDLHDQYVTQAYKGPDYAVLRRYWLLFLAVLYDPELTPGSALADVRPKVVRLIAARRPAFERRTVLPESACAR